MSSKTPLSSPNAANAELARQRPPSSSNTRPRFPYRNYVVPLTGLALGILFYIYSRTSIQAAKVNAQRYRDADGGSISWRNEALRRHGQLEKPAERTLLQQLFSGGEENADTARRRQAENRRLEEEGRRRSGGNAIEEGIRRAREGRERREKSDAGKKE